MLERPHDLPDAVIVARLQDAFGISPSRLEFLPLGNDSASFVYRAEADGQAFFVKARKDEVDGPPVTVPRFLHEYGISQVVAPLSTSDGRLWAPLQGEYRLLVYPFLHTRSVMDAGMPEAKWEEFGGILRRIHDVPVPPELAAALRRETFTPYWGEMMRAVQAQVDAGGQDDPIAAELAAFWRSRQADVDFIRERVETLGRALQDGLLPLALCHTDIHTANILIDGDGGLHIVDWDAPMLAPRERDLIYLVRNHSGPVAVSPSEEAAFLRGYGNVTLNPVAFAYYRYGWIGADVTEDGARVFLDPNAGEATKRHAGEAVRSLLRPEVVGAMREELEPTLPPELRAA